jgi:tRNA pseudouridine55 synthase
MSRRRPSRWHGLLPVYKKAGPTSHDIVDIARKALGERRIGHTGTLDPMAEGMLLLCVGRATRLQQYLLSWDKTYHGVVRLGYATTTYDAEGEAIDPQGEPPEINRAMLDEIEQSFSGKIKQIPPPYSAKKVAGRKLYELARSGEQVIVEPKEVTVHSLKIDGVEQGFLPLQASTSSGFYVRSLAHDMGLHLGCGAHLHSLRRVCIGPYSIEDAITQDDLEATTEPEEIVNGPRWVRLDQIQLPYPKITLNPGAGDRFRHGQEVIVLRAGTEPLSADSLVTVRSQTGTLLGIGRVENILARGRTLNIRPAVVIET